MEDFNVILTAVQSNPKALGAAIGFALYVAKRRENSVLAVIGRIIAFVGIMICFSLISSNGPIFGYGSPISEVLISGIIVYFVVECWVGDLLFPKRANENNQEE